MKRLKTASVVRVTSAFFRRPHGGGIHQSSAIGVQRWRLSMAALVAAVMILVLAFAQFASAQTDEGFSLTIPLDTVVYIPWDARQVLASEPVPERFAGQSCEVTAVSRNQESVHPDNDLIVQSGGSEVVIENVEDEPGGTVQAVGMLVLGSEVTVTLHMGPDAVFSAGLDVVIDCAQVTPTTLETTTTTIAATTTTLAATTTSEVAPTSTAPPPEETTTTEDEVLGTVITSTTAPPDEVEDLEVLPFTGPNDGGWAFLAAGLLALGGILVVASRRDEEA